MGYTGGGGIFDDGQQISNVSLTITDVTNQVEGETVTAVCNGKTFSSVMKKGICKIYSTEVGTYTITAGAYNTMLICPYFGQFSTDIYSGVLKITCTEAGGNNKTCHVQSCDDNYNFTDGYNLTQTFDSGLVLTFLGIPTGKYLITVDDKYRFFKEITSIQAVNEIEVELKQWLYKNGDQCVHNTGGWIQCQATGNINTIYHWYDMEAILPSKATHEESLQFTKNSLRLLQRFTAIESVKDYSYSSDYVRSDASSSIYAGTRKALALSLERYNQLVCSSTKPVVMTLRSGTANDVTTNTATATILVSGTGNINVSVHNIEGFCVFGKTANSTRGYGRLPNDGNNYNGGCKNTPQGNIDETEITDITEIYLI